MAQSEDDSSLMNNTQAGVPQVNTHTGTYSTHGNSLSHEPQGHVIEHRDSNDPLCLVPILLLTLYHSVGLFSSIFLFITLSLSHTHTLSLPTSVYAPPGGSIRKADPRPYCL